MATKWRQNGDKMAIKWATNDKMAKKLRQMEQNGDKMAKKWRLMEQNGDKMTTKSALKWR